ncbi:AMP-binding protein [Rhodococcus globerulus]|uniref:AMP-binding protein n=1 Tax=Rhodococcus globerulus TaxID=33008 RepID=A0ABU4C4J8_RHOGO|nr:AMP-binding protein [Rhodococcus globerulus]MDV6271416.1 AMP-binding protein [Rhodococcus globerulus]
MSTYLRQTARRYADRIAIIDGSESITWSRFDAGVDRLTRQLLDRGIRHGDPVLLHSPNCIQQVMAMYAVWRAGGILVPVNFRCSPAEIVTMARTSKSKMLIGHSDYPDHVSAVAEAGLLTLGHVVIDNELDESGDDSTVGFDSENPPIDARVGQDQPAWYFFTSGTSGNPKAAVLTHHTLSYIITNRLADIVPGTTQHDVSLAIAPLSHGAGTHLLCQVARGATTVLARSRPFDPDQIWDLIEEHRVTNLFTVPAILKQLAQSPAAESSDHSSLRYVLYGGAPMTMNDREHARSVIGDKLVQFYGMAEVTGTMTVLTPEDHELEPADINGIGPAGFPRIGVELSIQDESGLILPPGQTGEICAAGMPVFAGYLDNDTANREAFVNGWFRTGDIGYMNERGCLYITGRASDMYISGGHNIYPRELEEHLSRHPHIVEAAVVGIPDDEWGETGVAVCISDDTITPTKDELISWLSGRVARYKLPRHFVFQKTMPLSANGKVTKKDLRALIIDELRNLTGRS